MSKKKKSSKKGLKINWNWVNAILTAVGLFIAYLTLLDNNQLSELEQRFDYEKKVNNILEQRIHVIENNHSVLENDFDALNEKLDSLELYFRMQEEGASQYRVMLEQIDSIINYDRMDISFESKLLDGKKIRELRFAYYIRLSVIFITLLILNYFIFVFRRPKKYSKSLY